MGIFSDLIVIELASVLAGPSVGQFFAEGGAQVLKIENAAQGGDVTRSWKLPQEDPQNSRSAYFAAANWGKRSLSLDLSQPHDREQLYQRLPTADIVIVSYKPGDAQKLGMDYDTLKAFAPHIIYGSITGYGEASSRVGYDAIIQAEAGFVYMNGPMGGPGVKMPVALVDILAAHQLKEGILAMLYRRERMGLGGQVSVSLFDAAVSSLANQATNWLNARHISQPMGNEHPNIVPYGSIFITADQQRVMVAVGTDRQFERLCQVLEIPEVALDVRFGSNHQRVKYKAELLPLLERAFARHSRAVLLERGQAAGVPLGGVCTMPEVMAQAEHLLLKDADSSLRGIRNFIARLDGEPLDTSNLLPPPALEA